MNNLASPSYVAECSLNESTIYLFILSLNNCFCHEV